MKQLCLLLLFFCCWAPLHAQSTASGDSATVVASERDPRVEKLLALGAMYESNKLGGSRAPEAALRYYQKAAESGDEFALFSLARYYLKGPKALRDYQAAHRLMDQALEQYDSHYAQYLKGMAYKRGLGVAVDHTQAIDWFTQSAAHGHRASEYMLGYLYLKGLGVAQDYDSAVHYLSQAVAQGNYDAGHLLGWCYYRGYGVDQNLTRAREVLQTAAEQGSRMARQLLDKLAQDTTAVSASTRTQTNALTAVASSLASSVAVPGSSVSLGTATQPLTSATLNGSWYGKLITYDWAGEVPEEERPVQLHIQTQADTVRGTLVYEGDTAHWQGQFIDGRLVLDDVALHTYDLAPRPISCIMKQPVLEQVNLEGEPWLVAQLNTWVPRYQEPGQPSRLLLSQQEEEASPSAARTQAYLPADLSVKLFPNPHQGEVTLTFELPTATPTHLSIYNAQGQRVQQVLDGQVLSSGFHSLPLSLPPTGEVYLIKLVAGDYLRTLTAIHTP